MKAVLSLKALEEKFPLALKPLVVAGKPQDFMAFSSFAAISASSPHGYLPSVCDCLSFQIFLSF